MMDFNWKKKQRVVKVDMVEVSVESDERLGVDLGYIMYGVIGVSRYVEMVIFVKGLCVLGIRRIN